MPLVLTSLNISEKKPLNDHESILGYFKTDKPNLAVDAGRIQGKPSRILDIRERKIINVLRK